MTTKQLPKKTITLASAGAAGAVAASRVQNGMADIVDHISGKTAVKMSDIVGGDENLRKLSESVDRLTNRNGDTIDKIKRANMYNEWLTASEKLDAQTAKVIYQARQYYIDGDATNGLSEFRETYAAPDISANRLAIKTTVDGFLTDISVNYNTIFQLFDSVGYYDNNMVSDTVAIKEEALHNTLTNIGLYKDNVNLDVRKNLYEFESIDLFNNILYWLKIVYYAMFALYIIFGDFMKQQQYKNPYFYLVAIFYLLMPFTLKYIYALFMYLYGVVTGLLGIHKPVLSYNDIVQANNIDAIYTAPVPDIKQQREIENAFISGAMTMESIDNKGLNNLYDV